MKRTAILIILSGVLVAMAGCRSHSKFVDISALLSHDPNPPDVVMPERPATVAAALDTLTARNKFSYYGNNGWGYCPMEYVCEQMMADSLDDYSLDSLARSHRSPVVRATAGCILLSRQSWMAAPCLLDILGDTGWFTVMYFDVWSPQQVANLVVDWGFANHLISASDSAMLYDTLVSRPGLKHIGRRKEALDALPLTEENYDLFRRIYIEEDDGSAFVRMLRYHRDQDTATVASWLSRYGERRNLPRMKFGHRWTDLTNIALLAVEQWPLEDFKPQLAELRDFMTSPDYGMSRERTRYLFSAVMAYRDQWSLDFIAETFRQVRERKPNSVSSWLNWFGECLQRSYDLNPDEYYAQIVKEYGTGAPAPLGW